MLETYSAMKLLYSAMYD